MSSSENKPTKVIETFSYIALATEIALIMPTSIIISFFIGLYLDRWLNTPHIFLLIFMILGVFSGIKLVYSRIMKIGKSR